MALSPAPMLTVQLSNSSPSWSLKFKCQYELKFAKYVNQKFNQTCWTRTRTLPSSHSDCLSWIQPITISFNDTVRNLSKHYNFCWNETVTMIPDLAMGNYIVVSFMRLIYASIFKTYLQRRPRKYIHSLVWIAKKRKICSSCWVISSLLLLLYKLAQYNPWKKTWSL